jgi:hypothetical protein
LTQNLRKPSRLSSTISSSGSMSYFQNMPGMARSPMERSCSVTAYWLVTIVDLPVRRESAVEAEEETV